MLFELVGLVAGTAALFWTALWILSPVTRPRFEKEKYFLDPLTNKSLPFPELKDAPSVYLTLVVPSKDEEKRLPTTIMELEPYLMERAKKDKDFTYEVIIVDDGSTDGTTRIGHEWAKRHPLHSDAVRVLTLIKNRGKGGAVTHGMMSARGKYIIFLDADGATSVADLERLEREIKKTEKNGLGIAIGSRAHLVETEVVVKRSMIRNFLMRSFHLVVYILGVKDIKDTQCGFKLFTRKAAELIFPNMHVEGWIFDVEVLFIAEHLGIPITEVSVNWKEIPGSKMSLAVDSLKMAKDLFLIRMNYLLGRWSIKKTKRD